MKPLTILFVHSSDEMYGTDVILLKLFDKIDRNLISPIVVIPNDIAYSGLLTKALVERNIKIYHLKTAILRRKYFNPFGLILYLYRLALSTVKLLLIIRKDSVDIVHSNTLAVIPGSLAALLSRKPNVWHVHEIITSPKALWRFTSWLVPRVSKQVVAVSGPTRQHLCEGDSLNVQKSIVIHNGIDMTPFKQINSGLRVRSEWGISQDQPVVGMIGRFNSWKGQDYFVEVANQVLQNHPSARFVMVGGTFPGQEVRVDKIRALIDHYGLSSKIIISDFRSDIPAVLDAFDIFVLPSTQPDPLPTVVLEAMAAGKPIVANAHGGSIEMINDGKTGFLVEPGNQDAMTQAIERLISNPSERLKLGATGRTRLLTNFSIEAYVSNWTNVYLACR